ncbi:ankyrin repeat-containing protein At5g02620-like [Neltuma alba]|uniref:ankyrin repeat-containing protein At5g02620-like n=1 Tax=Neltuma alba TaxID=207710 RepID=UPI0010A3DE7B|nr:ankyrin repeat-containing protein At5g02620-like [Prosopis alba]
MEMENSHHHEEEKMIRVLYEASHNGCVSTLRTLIQQHPLVLHRINSRTTFIDTPLHISASLGHLEFTRVLLEHKPKLSLELDSFRSTALHIASAEGHIHIVKELLAAGEQACLVPDQEGRIPLHVAVIRGRLEVVTELIEAKPESLKILQKGKTVLHLCVTYNHLEILKALVDSRFEISAELLNRRDLDGNTVLHLAVMLKQVETVRYLVSIPKIQEVSTLKNKMGFTASDIVDGVPRDLRSLEIQVILMNNGFQSDKTETCIITQASTTSDAVEEAVKPVKKCWTKMIKCIGSWFEHNREWIEEMRGNLSLVATVISTITFQCVINPPGGFIQQDISNSNKAASPSSSPGAGNGSPGQAVLAFGPRNDFLFFIIPNTVAFVASLGVILLLISGLPLKNKVVMWMLSMGMCITLFALAQAYFAAFSMITSDEVQWSTDKTFERASWILVALFALAGGYILLAFLIWLVKYFIRFIKRIAMSMCGHRPVRRLP